MNKQKITALDALEAIKGIVLTHMEQDVDYDYEENPEYSYHEEYDGTIEDNYPDEIALIEKALKALKIIKEKQVNVWAFNMCDAVGVYNASIPNVMIKRLTQEEYDLLKEELK